MRTSFDYCVIIDQFEYVSNKIAGIQVNLSVFLMSMMVGHIELL